MAKKAFAIDVEKRFAVSIGPVFERPKHLWRQYAHGHEIGPFLECGATAIDGHHSQLACLLPLNFPMKTTSASEFSHDSGALSSLDDALGRVRSAALQYAIAPTLVWDFFNVGFMAAHVLDVFEAVDQHEQAGAGVHAQRPLAFSPRLKGLISSGDRVAFHRGLAAMAAGWFAAAGTDISMRGVVGASDCVARPGATGGLLAAALDLCTLLELTRDGRQAIADLIGKPVPREAAHE